MVEMTGRSSVQLIERHRWVRGSLREGLRGWGPREAAGWNGIRGVSSWESELLERQLPCLMHDLTLPHALCVTASLASSVLAQVMSKPSVTV